jgi:hypothetical protein
MRIRSLPLAVLTLTLSLPALAAKLVDAPLPPAMPEGQPERDGAPKKAVKEDTPSRGQLLYENHCTGCHESVVYIRNRRQVQSLPALRAEVVRWASYTNLSWGKEEVEEVVHYLNRHYYSLER